MLKAAVFCAVKLDGGLLTGVCIISSRIFTSVYQSL